MKSEKGILKYSSYYILATLIATAGCSKNFLKPKPLSFYTPENTYNSVDGLNAALVACERNLRYNWSGDGAPEITQLIFSDVAVDGTDDKSGPAQNMDLQITPDAVQYSIVKNANDAANHNNIFYYWDQGYADIKYANTVITYIDEPKWDTTNATQLTQRNDILGQAYFHRAYRYYELVNEFGDVPWIGKLYSEPKVNFQSVKRDVILQQIKSDMEFAAKWVTDDKSKGQVTKGACQHLLAKIDLALGDFDDAIKAASDLINGGVYHLMTNRFGSDANDPSKNVIWDLHQSNNKDIAANTEAMMLVIDKPDMDGNYANGTQIMRQTVPFFAGNKINTPNGNLGTTDAVTGVDFSLSLTYGRGLGRTRPSNYSQYTLWGNDNGDLRHAPGNWINMEDMVYNNPKLKGTDEYYLKHLQLYSSSGQLLCADTLREWFGFPYYKLYIPDDINTPPRGGNGDWYVFRLAETYLVRAEAYFWKGDLADAAADINVIRSRARAPLIAAADVNIGTILDERARELYYEEERKVELTRIAYLFAKTGKAAYNGKTYSLQNFSQDNFWYDRVLEKNNFYKLNIVTPHGDMYKISPYHVLWPVPQSAIDANTGAVINQNQGYSGADKNIAPLDEIPED